jgi:hypothetical protein
VVRGDQQIKTGYEDTYASTLAGRSFRSLIAIAARFDLELIQYDAVNAFVHARLDHDVFMQLPAGYRKDGFVAKLERALYGLRESPLLWQRDFSSTLKEIGFQPIPHEPCCMVKDGIIIFYYVDDIVLAFRKDKKEEAAELMRKLQTKYNIAGGDDLQWFLGIEIIRDRQNRLIWLSQSDYLDKIANLAQGSRKWVGTPMGKEELLPYAGIATELSRTLYQKKVGSILYAAVITRPDVAFAASRIARLSMNPGPEHHAAADRILYYLYATRFHALQLGGEDDFEVFSDASFADNRLDRKSSQAYVMRLFGGIVGWRANKQATVTTSTTEAELLALSQAAGEALYVSRLLKEVGIGLDDNRIKIWCDNLQTIKLVSDSIAQLKTQLRHVDIHNHWLRQEVAADRITVSYAPTGEMLADGLTKALQGAQFSQFRDQLGLVDIRDHVEQRKLRELDLDELRARAEDIHGDLRQEVINLHLTCEGATPTSSANVCYSFLPRGF